VRTVRAVHGVDALLADPQVLKARISVAPGTRVGPITTDGNRHGCLIVAGDINVARRKAALMSVTYD